MASVADRTSSIWDAIRGRQSDQCLCWVASIGETDVAVELATALARPGMCAVVLTLDSPSRLGAVCGAPQSRGGSLTPEMIGQAAGKLRELYRLDEEVLVLPGHPIREIRRYVRTHDVGLVVMGEQAVALEDQYGERLIDDPPCRIVVFVDPGRSTRRRPPRDTRSEGGKAREGQDR